MRPLAGKTALVTGAARGIGREIALRLAAKGVRVAMVDCDVVGLAGTRRDAERLGVEAFARPCDLASPGQIDLLARTMLERFAGVDLLVNNAGVARYGPTGEEPIDEAERLLAVNLHAPMRLTRRLLPSLLARPESHVLNVCSVLGLIATPKTSAYCASKFGLVGFSESLRREYNRSGLGVTTLCPTFVQTPLLRGATERSGKQPPALLCVSVDRVAAAAVRGIERNQRRVVVDPVGRYLRAAFSAAPGIFDWMYALGRAKRVARKAQHLASLDADRERALRIDLGLDADVQRRAA